VRNLSQGAFESLATVETLNGHAIKWWPDADAFVAQVGAEYKRSKDIGRVRKALQDATDVAVNGMDVTYGYAIAVSPVLITGTRRGRVVIRSLVDDGRPQAREVDDVFLYDAEAARAFAMLQEEKDQLEEAYRRKKQAIFQALQAIEERLTRVTAENFEQFVVPS
jgi:hypothetical protein